MIATDSLILVVTLKVGGILTPTIKLHYLYFNESNVSVSSNSNLESLSLDFTLLALDNKQSLKFQFQYAF